LELHYRAFQWAASKNWKDQNSLYHSIQSKMAVLVSDYDLTWQQVVDDLFKSYCERGHFEKFDPAKGSLRNWIARYIDLYLNHTIRNQASLRRRAMAGRVDPLDESNRDNLIWPDKDNAREDADFQPEVLIDPTNPENLLLAKEMWSAIFEHFTSEQVRVMTGDLELDEAAKMVGIKPDAFRKRLERRRTRFLESWRTDEQNRCEVRRAS